MIRLVRSSWLVLVLTVAVTACGIGGQDTAQQQPDDAVPFDLLDAEGVTATSIVASPDTIDVSLCLALDDATMVVVVRQLPRDATLGDILQSLAEPPTDQEAALGLTTALSETSRVTAVSAEAGVAKVELADEFVDSPAPDQLESVTQIVCTATRQPGIGQVQFQIGEGAAEVPRGDGSTTSEPVSPADYLELIP